MAEFMDGEGAKLYDKEKAWPSTSHSILSAIKYHTFPKIMYNFFFSGSAAERKLNALV